MVISEKTAINCVLLYGVFINYLLLTLYLMGYIINPVIDICFIVGGINDIFNFSITNYII